MKIVFVLLILIQTSTLTASDDMSRLMKGLLIDVSAEFKRVASEFIASAKSKDLKNMMKLTSAVTLKMLGKEKQEKVYTEDTIPFLRMCSLSDVGSREVSLKQSPTGPGWIYYKRCDYGKDQSVVFYFVILNEDHHIAVTSIWVVPPQKK